MCMHQSYFSNLWLNRLKLYHRNDNEIDLFSHQTMNKMADI